MADVPIAPPNAKPPANFAKQAVVVVHGIGEQMPMDTIKAFVRAAWETDTVITENGMTNPAEVWSKPDMRTGSLELRRITTRQSSKTESFPKGVRTDFYELYWADLSSGSTLDAIETWVMGLLFRDPRRSVPPKVMSAWLLLWVVSLGVLYLLAAPVVKPAGTILGVHPYGWMEGYPSWLGAFLGVVLGWFASALIKPYAGRVVRYTRATPDNIAARRDIRERGLALLDALHQGEYERIIIVGHSLGSILAYDLINYFWAARLSSHTFRESSPEFATLRSLETAQAAYIKEPTPERLKEFQRAQRRMSTLLRNRPKPAPGPDGKIDPAHDTRWLITDFVTLGSPLTHATFLLASDRATFEERVATREFSVSPPIRELLDQPNWGRATAAGMPLEPSDAPELLSFPFVPDNWQMHHAAAFAVTSWTNIHDNARFILCGDFVSGSLAPLFGYAVTDVDLATKRGQSRSFTHTKYWQQQRDKCPPQPHIVELRKALNLAGQVGPV